SRENTDRPTISSSFLICMETAEGVRNTILAAVVKLPVSAIATNVRSTSSSSNGIGWLKGAFMIKPSIRLIDNISSLRLIERQTACIVKLQTSRDGVERCYY